VKGTLADSEHAADRGAGNSTLSMAPGVPDSPSPLEHSKGQGLGSCGAVTDMTLHRGQLCLSQCSQKGWSPGLTPVIPATWEAEIRRIEVRGQWGQTVHETLISKITRVKWTGGVAQVVVSALQV
jgi:hypothetical protein